MAVPLDSQQVERVIGDCAALEVVQDHGLALSFGQLVQRVGQANRLFVALGMLTRRRLLRREPRCEPGGGCAQRRFQRMLAGHVALVPAEVAHGVGQVAREDLPQPRRTFAVTASAKLIAGLVRLQKRLLHDVRGIQFALEARVQVQLGQQQQVGAKLLQRRAAGAQLVAHPRLLGIKRPFALRWCARAEFFKLFGRHSAEKLETIVHAPSWRNHPAPKLKRYRRFLGDTAPRAAYH
jgi:hypothetical protein